MVCVSRSHSTTWVSEMFLQGRSLADNDSRLVDEAERIGSRAMFWHALVNLAAATFIPFLVNQEFSVAAEPAYRSRPEYTSTDSPLDRIKDALRPLLATLAPHLPTLPLEWLSLSLTWTFGNALFAVLLLSTFFAHNALGASFIIGITGLSWAITAWVPFSLVRGVVSD